MTPIYRRMQNRNVDRYIGFIVLVVRFVCQSKPKKEKKRTTLRSPGSRPFYTQLTNSGTHESRCVPILAPTRVVVIARILIEIRGTDLSECYATNFPLSMITALFTK